MNDVSPFIRIALYVVVGWLASKGLPREVAEIITTDPTILAVLSEALAGVVFVLTLLWWRIAKRFGWAT